jgi:hypothetical protein
MLNSANNGATGASDTSPSSGYIFGLTVFIMLSKIFVMISLLPQTKSLHLFFG